MSDNKFFDSTRSGKRYAILYAGTGDLCTLNDLEYCYRLLTGPDPNGYGFLKTDVSVYYYSGRPETDDPANPATCFPNATTGDNYTIVINGAGNAGNFHDACARLADILKPEDLVFIHTNGHGGFKKSKPYLLTYGTDGEGYYADKFCEALALLPQHASMLIVMQQCNGGHFADAIAKARSSINAKLLSFAAASKGVAHFNAYKDFSHFTEAWVDAHFDKDPLGQALEKEVPGDDSGFIEAGEAYNYARGIADDFGDSPRTRNSPGDSREIILA
jgi:hypothetical protein